VITPGQRQLFEENGLTIIDPQIDTATIDAVVSRIGNDVLGAGKPPAEAIHSNRPGSGRVVDAWKFDASVRQIALAPAVLAALSDLYGRRPQPFQTLNFRIGTEQKIHADTVHFNSEPSGFMCGVWLALEDIDEDNGALLYYPTSHKLPEFNLTHVFADAKFAARRPAPLDRPYSLSAIKRRFRGLTPKYDMEKDYLLYEEFIEAKLASMPNLRPALGTIKKGQALIWAANLLHGGSRQKDASRTRHSQVTHYFFEGCKYHRPLHNSDGKVRYDEKVEWVR
jgi:ectoine hydroxylase-related dioxygenase (phytanoyl-CoA dioxygenase family)